MTIKKTIRFNPNIEDARKAYDILHDHLAYGYKTESDMVIAGILKLLEDDDIVARIERAIKDNMTSLNLKSSPINQKTLDSNTEDFVASIDQALDFIDSL